MVRSSSGAPRPRRARSRREPRAARRPSPGAIARATCARSRSATPPIPPRRPTIRQSPPCSTTWTPRRASQPRSSKPSRPHAGGDRARKSRTAPCGGDAADRELEQDSLAERARIEAAHLGREREARTASFGGAGDDDLAPADRPISGASTLRSSASRRSASPPPAGESDGDAHRPEGEPPTPGRRRRRRPTTQGEDERRRTHARWRARARRRRRGRAASASRARRCARSRRHEVPQLLDPRRADARDRVEILDRAEGAVRRPGSRRSSAPSPARCPAARRAPRAEAELRLGPSRGSTSRPPPGTAARHDAPASRRRAARRG